MTLIAADALGPERVSCVVMPSPHSSRETQADARALIANVGAELVEIPIEPAMRAYEDLLPVSSDGAAAQGHGAELAAENIQARIRGNLMMALSNRHGWLVLTTGNKSEMSVGYATLYGDMAGGFAVIKDVPKTLVYDLVRYRNELSGGELVPQSVLDRPPTAELRPGPARPGLAAALRDARPHPRGLRRGGPWPRRDRRRRDPTGDRGRGDLDGRPLRVQAPPVPPGIRITPKAFGRDRRLPITNRYRG